MICLSESPQMYFYRNFQKRFFTFTTYVCTVYRPNKQSINIQSMIKNNKPWTHANRDWPFSWKPVPILSRPGLCVTVVVKKRDNIYDGARQRRHHDPTRPFRDLFCLGSIGAYVINWLVSRVLRILANFPVNIGEINLRRLFFSHHGCSRN